MDLESKNASKMKPGISPCKKRGCRRKGGGALGVGEPRKDRCGELVGLAAGVAAAPQVLDGHLKRRPPVKH